MDLIEQQKNTIRIWKKDNIKTVNVYTVLLRRAYPNKYLTSIEVNNYYWNPGFHAFTQSYSNAYLGARLFLTHDAAKKYLNSTLKNIYNFEHGCEKIIVRLKAKAKDFIGYGEKLSVWGAYSVLFKEIWLTKKEYNKVMHFTKEEYNKVMNISTCVW